MPPYLVELAGWIPAVIIPVATFIQILSIYRSGTAQGVSWMSWALFGIANIGLYIFTEKYFELQSLLGMVLPAILDFVIVALVLARYGRDRPNKA